MTIIGPSIATGFRFRGWAPVAVGARDDGPARRLGVASDFSTVTGSGAALGGGPRSSGARCAPVHLDVRCKFAFLHEQSGGYRHFLCCPMLRLVFGTQGSEVLILSLRPVATPCTASMPISGFVISYNRADLLATCLHEVLQLI